MARAEQKVAYPHQPALDGVRAVAVLAVLGYHLSISAADGGFIGVDIFFVLSGFLITTLLVIERRDTERIDLLRFWGRRIRRLLPALLLLLLLVAVYALLVAPPEQLERIRSDGLASLFYVENWHLAFASGATSPLSHTWSLAIEEQWYLIWPPLFLLLAWLLRGRNERLFVAALALAALSALDMAFLGETRRAYYGTDARVQALLLGAALAFLLQVVPDPTRRAPRFLVEGAGIAGVVVLGALVVHPVSWMARGGYLLVALAAVALIGAVTQRHSPILRPLLSWRPLVALGLISYGVYLYHFFVIVWLNHARTGLGPVPLIVLRVVVTIGLATASYYAIEMPVRRGTFLTPRARTVLAPIGVVLMVLILLITTTGAPAPASAAEQLWSEMRERAPAGSQRVLLVGDSTPAFVALAMRGPYDGHGAHAAALGSVTCPIADAFPPPATARPASIPACRRHAREVTQAIDSYRPAVVVVGREPGADPAMVAGVVARIRRRHPRSEVVTVDLAADADGPSGALTKPVAEDVWSRILADLPAGG